MDEQKQENKKGFFKKIGSFFQSNDEVYESEEPVVVEEEPIIEEPMPEEPIIEEPAAEEAIIEEPITEEPQPAKKGFFKKMIAGLDKTRKNMLGGIENVLGAFTKIDEELFEELEEALILADIGVQTATDIVEQLRQRVKRDRVTEADGVRTILTEVISEMLTKDETPLELPSPTIILVIGVNGVGKTTSIGKLAAHYKAAGKNVLLAAADTFRAAAIDQLEVWGERSGVPVIRHQENSDPAAVVFDAIQAAKARNADLLICDTAGRLHNKKNLMEELRKIAKIIAREYPEAHYESFIVLDATTGQNALQQATLFREIADLTGIILTKLDGTAKGGVVIAIQNELHLPVRFVGVGEAIDDMQPFDAKDFAAALFAQE